MSDTEGKKQKGLTDQQRRFYVYAICIGAHVAYIGKGCGRRARAHLGAGCDNQELRRRIIEARRQGQRPKARILKGGLTECEAYALERRWIVRFHDRLTNHSIGHRTWRQRRADQLRADLASLTTNEAQLSELQVTYLRKIKARLNRLLDAIETGALA